MTELTPNLSLAQARSLIDSYAFDLEGNDLDKLLQSWLKLYQASWIKMATIEALYLGRYKTISIEQILNVWLRMGSPNPHFTYEFERLICRKLPKHLSDLADSPPNEVAKQVAKPFDWEPEPSQQAVSPSPASTKSESTTAIASSAKAHSDKMLHPRSPEKDNTPLVSARANDRLNWSELTQDHKSIHQFIPLPDVSSFFNKLKTFAE